MDYRITSDRLRTIKDVKREQRLMDERLGRQRCLLCYDREQIAEVLEPQYWINILSAKASGIVEGFTGRLASRLRGSALGTGWLSGAIGRLSGWLFRRRQPAAEYFVVEEDFDGPDCDDFSESGSR